jgi:hypothetical protein
VHEFAVIPFDLHAGMLGYRLLLIHRDVLRVLRTSTTRNNSGK